MKKISLFVSIVVFGAAAFFAVAAGNNHNEGAMRRVLARSASEVAQAQAHGCRLARQVNDLYAFVCAEKDADLLGLLEDIRVFALDTGANSQIGATAVQVAGNTGSGRKVVILDTGYNYGHPELSSSYLGGKDFVNNDDDPMDDEGHGSHVAGIITADGVTSQAKGVAPDAGVIAGKVLDASGSGFFSDIIAGVYWAVDGADGIASTSDDFNADAINMSLGTGNPYLYKGFCDNVMPELTAAIKYAKDHGVIVVVAAGNTSRGVSIPGCISYSTTVGAVDGADKIAKFSGKGSAVDLTAPGVNIFSSVLGSGYATWSGTSMATPMVAGVVALVKSAHSGYTPAQVEQAMFSTAKDLGSAGKDNTFGWGRVNALGAVQ